jgi:hypothetical protein
VFKTTDYSRFIFLLPLVIFVLTSVTTDGLDWTIETVSGEAVYFDTSIGVDSSVDPHITVAKGTEPSSQEALYWYKNGFDWEYEVWGSEGETFPGTRRDVSLAVDSNDNICMAYRHGCGYPSSDEDAVDYAYWDGSSMSEVVIGYYDGVYTHIAVDIAVDSLNRPHLLYDVDEDYGLEYVYWDGSDWVYELIDLGVRVRDLSLALDSQDRPHFSYQDHDKDKLMYGYWNGSDWVYSTVEEGGFPGDFNSIALDSYDVPHVAYESEGEVRYAYWDGSGWDITAVGDPAIPEYISLAIDSTDRPHISYTDGDGLYYAVLNADWDVELVDEFWDGILFSSIDVDSLNRPHLSYYTEGLMYARGFSNTPPSSFNLSQPPDGAEVSEPVTLDWEDSIDDDGDTITYDVWYATDPSFDPHDEVTELTDSTYTFPEGVLTPGDTYYWKVRAWDGYEGTWSGPDPYWSFTVNAPPGYFDLTAPPDGSVVAEPVVLDWEDSVDPGRTLTAGAGSFRAAADTVRSESTRSISYDVWYAADPSFDPHDEVNELTDSTYTFPEGTFSDGTTYYWKVRAWDGYEETWSGPDPYWSFTVEEEITDISVTRFSAESARTGVELTWECADPGVGFNLYRSEEALGMRTKSREILNAEPITGESPYVYLDSNVSDGVTYSYWLEAMGLGGVSETFGPVSCTAGTFVPSSYALYQSRPNPARGTAVIAFDLPEDADVTLTIYDLSGRKVTTLVNDTLPAGAYERTVSGLAPGVYVYRLKAGEFSAVRKMVIVGSDL